MTLLFVVPDGSRVPFITWNLGKALQQSPCTQALVWSLLKLPCWDLRYPLPTHLWVNGFPFPKVGYVIVRWREAVFFFDLRVAEIVMSHHLKKSHWLIDSDLRLSSQTTAIRWFPRHTLLSKNRVNSWYERGGESKKAGLGCVVCVCVCVCVKKKAPSFDISHFLCEWYCWWFRNPKTTIWDGAKTRRISWDFNYEPQLVSLPDVWTIHSKD